jgi:hypothetical protein
MSWVTDIILLCDLCETFTEEFEILEHPPAIVGINTWLEAGGWASLVRFDDYVGMRSEKAFQACAYGAALNFLDVPGLLGAIASQPWEKPDALLLLLKKEEDAGFTLYRMRDGELAPQPMEPR